MIIKDYILTNHAKLRMKERNISEEELREALESPDISYPGKRGEVNVVKEIKIGKKVRVTDVVERKKKIIITAIVMG